MLTIFFVVSSNLMSVLTYCCFSPSMMDGGQMHPAGLVHGGPQPHPGPHILQHNQQMPSMPVLPDNQIHMNNIQMNNPGQVLQANVQPSPSPPTQVTL
jgi:hypothetical protein